MRPVHRGESPLEGDFENYRDAFPHLAGRLGSYCSFCERRIEVPLAVEHIQPKALSAYAHLIGRWDNFLLGCINCNSTKGDKDVRLHALFFPDRDNTYAAFDYTPDGRVLPAAGISDESRDIAEETLKLTGLDKRSSQVHDENGRLIAIERMSRRMQVWMIAEESRNELEGNPTENMRRQIVRTALAEGAFSIWMRVFADDSDMRQRFIREFPGTAADCFDALGHAVSPRPNNGLEGCGKI